MKLALPDGPLSGEITLPISKSIANRFQIMAALAESPISILDPAPEDVKVLSDALNATTTEVHVGLAGTAMRFLTAYFSIIQDRQVLLVGDARMYQRPIGDLVEALQLLGAEINYLEEHGFPPLYIHGKTLPGGTINMPASVSSQFISALMMIAPKMKNGLTILLEGKVLSRPYIELTADCMRQCGIDVQFNGSTIKIPSADHQIPNLEIETDWSAASYFYALVASRPNSKLLLKGLNLNSKQGDSILAKWFGHMGVSSEQKENGVEIVSSNRLEFPTELDFTGNPDLAQTFAFLAATLGKPLKLTGLDTLRIKETDRVAAIKTELEKLGISVSVTGDSMCISGSISVGQANICTYNDHRMAMSAAIVSTVIPTEIEDPEVAGKSFPTFWTELCNLGLIIE
jgi:3-phosphoshikimate 1-carboxyvinyltransferase